MSNTQIKPRVIFIGPEQVGRFLESKREDWSFVAILSNIPALWKGLDDGTIDENIDIIITLDALSNQNNEEKSQSLEYLVAMMAPHCFFGLIQYRPVQEARIREKIIEESITLGNGENPEFYFIDKSQPTTTINKAVARYIQNNQGSPIANILEGKEPDYKPEPAQEIVIQQNYDFEAPDDNEYLGKVVAVTSSKGGSGKSTVAISLGTYLAHASENSAREGLEEKPLKILILDLDIRDGQIGFLTGNMSPTVLNMRSKGIDDESFAETVIHSSRLKLDLLLATKRPKLADDTPPEFYLELIQFLKLRYDYIILDTSVNYLDPLLEKIAYPIADLIVFVTDIVVNSIYSMTRWIQEVTEPKSRTGMGIDKRKIGIVVNKSMLNVNMPGEKIKNSALGLPILSVIPNNAKLLAHAANITSMETVIQHKDIKRAIERIAKSVVGKNYKLSTNVA